MAKPQNDAPTDNTSSPPANAPTPAAGESSPTPPPPPPPPPADSPFRRLVKVARAKLTDDEIKKAAVDYVIDAVKNTGTTTLYNLLVLYDDSLITDADSDQIYSACQQFKDKKPILLVIHSGGGIVSPAYFISKVCREYSPERFIVAVPRRAKSAAALICCGADEIHMGSLSELGPIDPQIDRMPALGLKHAIQNLADLVRTHPAASEMFASYLAKSLKLTQLGYYERVAESAMQYAERLLASRKTQNNTPFAQIAKQLVYEYKDHGFAIDADEAGRIFGPKVVLRNTPEYKLANELYSAIDVAHYLVETHAKRRLVCVGTLQDGFGIYGK